MYGIPYYIPAPLSQEERIEEARRSGLIRDLKNLDGPNAEVFCCKRCGSTNVIVGYPEIDDDEKGAELPYYCNNCDYSGYRMVRITGMDEEGTLKVQLIPDGLVGLTGTFVGNNY